MGPETDKILEQWSRRSPTWKPLELYATPLEAERTIDLLITTIQSYQLQVGQALLAAIHGDNDLAAKKLLETFTLQCAPWSRYRSYAQLDKPWFPEKDST